MSWTQSKATRINTRGELPELNGSDYPPHEREPLEDRQRLCQCLQVKNLWNVHAEPKVLASYYATFGHSTASSDK